MRRSRLHDDPATEALLSGDPVSPELQPLADAVREVRAAAHEYVEPSSELGERIATGDFAGITPAVVGSESARGRRWWPMLSSWRPRTRVVAGVAVVLVGFTGVTAAGALPDAAQRRVESFVESVSPIRFYEPAGDVVEDDVRDHGDGGRPADEVGPASGRGAGIGAGEQDDPPGKSQDARPDTPGEKPGTPDGKPEAPGEKSEAPGEKSEAPGEKPETPGKPSTSAPDPPADPPAQPPRGKPENRPTGSGR